MTFVIIAAMLDLGAAIWYAAVGDKARAVYWLAAAVLTFDTLFMK